MPKRNVREGAAVAAVQEAVVHLGTNIATARKRRRWRQVDLAARAGISPLTVHRIEAGELGTAIGPIAAVLWALGLLPSLQQVADPEHDAEGATLASAREGERVRLARTLSDEF